MLTSPAATSQTSQPPAATSPAPGRRGRKQIKRFEPQPTKLESVDDTLGPLGPLGENAAPAEATAVESPQQPIAPQAIGSGATSQHSSLRAMMDETHLD